MALGEKNISDPQWRTSRCASLEPTASKKRTSYTQLFIGLFTLSLILSSCGGSKKIIEERVEVSPKTKPAQAVQTSQLKTEDEIPKKELTNKEKILAYINRYAPIAQKEMQAYGIPASITMAQGILESGMGYGRLAVEGNNHFGIKCHKEWEGQRIYHDDDKKGECFRVYGAPENSFKDHSVFLKTRSRYAFLFELNPSDYKAWAKGLKKAGYATDPQYPDKLISLIERFDLDDLDIAIKDKALAKNKKAKSSDLIHQVQKGDTLYSLSKLYQVSVEQLVKHNKIKDQKIYLGQSLIIPTNP